MKTSISTNSLQQVSFILIITLSSLNLNSCINSKNNPEIDMKIQLKDQLTTLTKDFFRLFEAKDFDNWLELWAADAIVHAPYASGMFPEKMIGKDAIYEAFEPISRNFKNISLNVHEIIVDIEKKRVVARLEGDMIKLNGDIYHNSYIFIFHFDENNKIEECFEYFNPYLAGKTFGLLDKLEL